MTTSPAVARSRRRLSALLLLASAVAMAPTRAARADQFTAERRLSWESLRENGRSFFSNVFLGGVDEDGDGELSGEERANAGIFRSAAGASLLAGLVCGLLGSFIVLRRMALFGDMLGHAVLPGVAAGFMLAGSKSASALLPGALVAGLLAAGLTKAIRSWSRVKEDAALGISLSLFYALGIWLLSWIARDADLSSEASGLDQYLFGNPAVIHPADLVALGVAALVVISAVGIGFKELLTCAFDQGFAASIGLPRRELDWILLVLLTVVIVVSIKILGVVLVAALLVIPPATAHLLTDRFLRLCVLSSALGAAAGFCGTLLSALFSLGAGPAIVCAAFAMLVVAFLASPRHGVLGRYLLHRGLALRTARENLLAAAYRIIEREREGAAGTGFEVPLETVAAERGEPLEATRALARKLRGSGWGSAERDHLLVTAAGEDRARRVVRVHRLWELFLSREASLPPDHVHPGAEEIEHYLDAEAIEELERILDHPTTDPHGRAIPANAAKEAAGPSGGGARKERPR